MLQDPVKLIPDEVKGSGKKNKADLLNKVIKLNEILHRIERGNICSIIEQDVK